MKPAVKTYFTISMRRSRPTRAGSSTCRVFPGSKVDTILNGFRGLDKEPELQKLSHSSRAKEPWHGVDRERRQLSVIGNTSVCFVCNPHLYLMAHGVCPHGCLFLVGCNRFSAEGGPPLPAVNSPTETNAKLNLARFMCGLNLPELWILGDTVQTVRTDRVVIIRAIE